LEPLQFSPGSSAGDRQISQGNQTAGTCAGSSAYDQGDEAMRCQGQLAGPSASARPFLHIGITYSVSESAGGHRRRPQKGHAQVMEPGIVTDLRRAKPCAQWLCSGSSAALATTARPPQMGCHRMTAIGSIGSRAQETIHPMFLNGPPRRPPLIRCHAAPRRVGPEVQRQISSPLALGRCRP
jgi:hypothetical protein